MTMKNGRLLITEGQQRILTICFDYTIETKVSI